MEFTLHPAKRARREYLDEQGPQLALEPTIEDQLLQAVVDNDILSEEHSLPLERVQDIYQAVAELNQLMNVIELIRGKEYMKLLPVRRETIGSKGKPLQGQERVAFKDQRLQAADIILARGCEESQHVTERRRLYYTALQDLKSRWNFILSMDPNTRNVKLSIDCSLARFNQRPLVNLTGRTHDHLVPLDISNQGEAPIDIPPSIINKEYFNLRIQIINSITLIPILSLNSIDICMASYPSDSIEYFASLNHHSHLSQQVFHSLHIGMKECSHRVARTFQADADPIHDSRVHDSFLQNLTCTAKEKSRVIFDITTNFSLLMELTPVRKHLLEGTSLIDTHPLASYLLVPLTKVLNMIFLVVVDLVSMEDAPVGRKATEKLRKPFLDAKNQAIGDAYHELVRDVIRATRVAMNIAYVEEAIKEMGNIDKLSVVRTHLESDYWNLKSSRQIAVKTHELQSSNSNFVVEADGSSVKIIQYAVADKLPVDREVVGKYTLVETKGLREFLTSKLL